MSSTTSICAEGGLVLHVYWSTVYIWLVLCSLHHWVSPLLFRYWLIQISTLAVVWRHSPSWTCWRDAGRDPRISELDIGWSPPAECSKWFLNVAEFLAEVHVDMSVRRFILPWFDHSFQVTHCCFLISSDNSATDILSSVIWLLPSSCLSSSCYGSSTLFLRYFICMLSMSCIRSESPYV